MRARPVCRRVSVIVIVCGVCLGVEFAAHAPLSAQQARDTVVRPVGSGSITGRVVTDESQSRPVRRASVTLASGELQLPQVTVTDDDGSFAFAALPAGSYTLVAQKAAYVTSFFGGKRPGKGPGVPIALLEGQHLSNVAVRLLHGAVITGIVRTQSGQPIVNLDVQAALIRAGSPQRAAAMPSAMAAEVSAATGDGGSATTDDRGVYRIYGLAPGPYVVQTRADSLAVAEARRTTQAEVQWATQSAAQSAPLNPGAQPPALEPAPGAGQTVNYAPVFYPGTTDPAAAATVSVAPNEERNGVDFTTILVPTAHVTGTLVDADGRPVAGGQISLRSGQADAFSDVLSALIGGGGSRTGPDGRFTLQDVAPGHYTVTARATPRAAGAPAAPESPFSQLPPGFANMFGGGMGTPGAQTMWAMADINVDGFDIGDVTLSLQNGMTVSGKVVFEGGAAPADPTRTRVSLNPLPTSASPVALATSMIMGGNSTALEADGAFHIKGVMPDKYRIGLTQGMFMPVGALPSSGWFVKSALLGGRDVSDVAFDVKPSQDITGVVITLTNHPTELSGTVRDGAGRPAPGFPIVVFATDRAYWTIGSRRVQQARPASDGTYKLSGLPAGEYYVAAVTDLDPNDLYDAVFLEQLVAQSFKIALVDGEKKTTDLRLGGGTTTTADPTAHRSPAG